MQANPVKVVKSLIEMRSRRRKAEAVFAAMAGWEPCQRCGRLTDDKIFKKFDIGPAAIKIPISNCRRCLRLRKVNWFMVGSMVSASIAQVASAVVFHHTLLNVTAWATVYLPAYLVWIGLNAFDWLVRYRNDVNRRMTADDCDGGFED